MITEALINFTFDFSLTFVSSYTGGLECFFLILAWEKIQLFQLFLLFTVIRTFIRRHFVISTQNAHNRVLLIHVTALVLNYPDRKIPDATKFSWVSLCHPVCLRNNLVWSEHSQPKYIYEEESKLQTDVYYRTTICNFDFRITHIWLKSEKVKKEKKGPSHLKLKCLVLNCTSEHNYAWSGSNGHLLPSPHQ